MRGSRGNLTRQMWTNHIITPLVFAGIVACAWYGLANRPAAVTAGAPAPHTVSLPRTMADATPIAATPPVVSTQGDEVHISLDPKPYARVKKVEFYIEDTFVGAAFTQPYAVSVNQNNLSAGTHSVTAKVYAAGTAAQTTPALFTANPSAPAKPMDDDAKPSTAQPQANGGDTTAPAPTGLTAVAATDGTQAQLAWNGSGASYQIWRDGAVVATSAIPSYTDTGLMPGRTYDYSIVALDGSGHTSAASAQVGVTMPVPPNTSPVNGYDVAPPLPPPATINTETSTVTVQTDTTTNDAPPAPTN